MSLHRNVGAGEFVLYASGFHDVVDRAGDFVCLCRCHLRGVYRNHAEVRTCVDELLDIDISVGVVDVVAVVSRQHLFGVRSVRHPVFVDFEAGQVVLVSLHAVNMDVAVVGSDSEQLRIILGEVVVVGVNCHLRGNAFKPDHHYAVAAIGFDVDVHFDDAVLAVRYVHFGELRSYGRSLRLEFDADVVCEARENLCVVVSAVGCLENEFQLLAGSHGVVCKEGLVGFDVGAAFYTEVCVAVGVGFEAAVRPVEIVGEGQRVVRAGAVLVSEFLAVGIVVGVPCRVKVKYETGGHRFHADSDVLDFEGYRLDDVSAGDGEVLCARCVGFVAPGLARSVDGQVGYDFAVHLEGDVSCQARRVVDDVWD